MRKNTFALILGSFFAFTILAMALIKVTQPKPAAPNPASVVFKNAAKTPIAL